jgi:predicted nucleic acid-binding protein
MKLKIVIDTNVLFEGLTNENSPSSQVIDALI